MAANSKIEWTEATWNCLAGCEAVSPGCANCYAAMMTRRLEAMGQADYAALTTHKHFNGVVRCLPHKLDIPLKRRKPTMYFVNSMSDLFQEGVPDFYVEQVARVMQLANRHTYQVLTKRADRMREMLAGPLRFAAHDEHIWWGVSVEDKRFGLPRLDALLETPAAMRFLSIEPLLEDLGKINLDGIDWVIVGGESGPASRRCHSDWILSIIEQCKAAKVPVFVKQLGANPEGYTNEVLAGLSDRKGGDMAEWPKILRVRQMPEVANA